MRYRKSTVLFVLILILCGISSCNICDSNKADTAPDYVTIAGFDNKDNLFNFMQAKGAKISFNKNGDCLIYSTIQTRNALFNLLKTIRKKINTISVNISNAYTTRDGSGKSNPFRRKVIEINNDGTVRVEDDTSTPVIKKYDPHHPDAIKTGKDKGYVLYPNIEITHEMTDMLCATREYEFVVSILQALFPSVIFWEKSAAVNIQEKN